jgi:A/G-specific adenine glycosylase
VNGFAPKLINWYTHHARDLPWRGHPNPYAVWVSEIMLQQTRVEVVIPYFKRWMRRFPSMRALASASQQEVLSHWEGLGYYSRARNLHRGAQIVMQKHQGKLPTDMLTLQSLPGIGRYTAAAIASIAFGADVPAMDGNVRRVLSRVFDVSEPVRSSAGERRLWELAEAHLPPGRGGDYNQALMDLGALICTARSPNCALCPLADQCLARARGIQEQRPVRLRKTKPPHHTVTAAIIQRNGQVLIAQRPQNGLLGGLWEFPGGKQEPGEDLVACLRREIEEELGVAVRVDSPLGVYKHAYTHFRVTLHAFRCVLHDGDPQPKEHRAVRWVSFAELSEYPMGKIDRQIADTLAHS